MHDKTQVCIQLVMLVRVRVGVIQIHSLNLGYVLQVIPLEAGELRWWIMNLCLRFTNAQMTAVSSQPV